MAIVNLYQINELFMCPTSIILKLILIFISSEEKVAEMVFHCKYIRPLKLMFILHVKQY